MITKKVRKRIDGYGRYLDEGTGLSPYDHEIREQAYKADTIIKEQEVTAGNTDMVLAEFDILEIFYALAEWGRKQEGDFWEEQVSH